MLRLRTLTGRFGALYAFVIANLVGVCVIVIVHLGHIRLDSERITEETREQTITARITAEITSLESLLSNSAEISPEEFEQARGLLRTSVEGLAELDDHDRDDPSRKEHQEVENRLEDRFLSDMSRLDKLLGDVPRGRRMADVLEQLGTAKHYVEVLFSEARKEAGEASRDLEQRARSTRTVMLLVLVSASMMLAIALLVVHRSVVIPLRELRAGAERFGKGELEHRIRVVNKDEIGDLAFSFNIMADRLADAQEHLEERVRARTQEFLRAARLADLGILASGIAHEINTPLASIATCAEGLLRRVSETPRLSEVAGEYLEIIRQETYRASEITARMLALVRQEPSALSQVSLRLVTERAEAALRYKAERAGVELAREDPEQDETLTINAGELVQIVANLLANAIDASEPGGRVVLRASVLGRELILEVEDRGSGLREEDLERVFDPFFTTKRPGEGTGLGLALVSTMVESHRGRVTVQSKLDYGSVFRVTLPIDWTATA